MRILITVGRLDIGGVELRTIETINALKNIYPHLQFYIYVVSGRRGTLDNAYREEGVKLIYGKGSYKSIRHLYLMIKSIKPDVLHVNASYAGGIFTCIGWMAGCSERIAHIRSVYLPEMHWLFKSKYLLYLPMLNIFSTKVIGVAGHAKLTARTPDKKWTTVYDGIEPSHIARTKDEGDDALQLVVVGRQHVCKNLHFALEVLKSLLNRQVRAHLTFVGAEDDKIGGELRSQAYEKGLLESVTFAGAVPRNKALEYMACSDVLLVTSTREGLPGTILEASSVGLPVLSSDLPGVVEISAHIDSVWTRSLCEEASRWGDAVLEIRDCWSHKSLEIISKFNSSPFTLAKHTFTMAKIWGLDE